MQLSKIPESNDSPFAREVNSKTRLSIKPYTSQYIDRTSLQTHQHESVKCTPGTINIRWIQPAGYVSRTTQTKQHMQICLL